MIFGPIGTNSGRSLTDELSIMADPGKAPGLGSDLRQEAEVQMRGKVVGKPGAPQTNSLEAAQKLLHDLHQHQAELEMQNEELRRVQLALDTAKTRYFDLYNLAPVGYCTLTRMGLILEANVTAATLFGLTRDLVIKRAFFQFISTEDRNLFHLSWARLLDTGAPLGFDMRLLKADGTPFWGQLTATVGQETDGQDTFRLVVVDITDRRRTEERLRASEDRFRKLFERHSAIKLVIEADTGKIIDANAAAATFYGWSIEQLTQMRIQQINTLAPEAIQREMEHARSSGCNRFEFRHRRADGSVSDVEVFSNKVESMGEEYLYSIIHDISERKQAEETLREAHQFNQEILQSAQEGVVVYGRDLRYQVWNPFMERLSGKSASEVIGRHPTEVFPFLAEVGLIERLEKALAGEVVKPIDFPFATTASGRSGWTLDACAPLRNRDGEIIGVIGTITDITERKQAEEEGQKLRVQLQQSQRMESLGTLAGGVAHDMNNVLGAILGLASAHIGTLPNGSPLHQALDTICKATERGGKMVKSLLSFARQTPAENRELDLNTILREQMDLLERTTLAKVRLQLDLDPELRPIRGDANALAHAFMNLSVNAADAMPETGTLSLSTRNVDGNWIEIVVEDTGMGMPKEVLEKAIDPFFTTKGVGKGTGLGLTMVHASVTAHRGHLSIQSEPGQGTRVVLRFPACEREALMAVAATAEVALFPQGALKVLLVDDDELIQTSVQMLLEVLGHTVTPAQSGEEALALVAGGFNPDLVILDMNMPGLGGAGTLPRLRALCPRVPVLLSTGRTDQTALALALAHPGVTLLAKPFGLRELRGHLDEIGQAQPSV